MSKAVIIGGGAAGMLASIIAASGGHETVLYEKNEKLGKKLYITGKGRCNITNACDTEELFPNILSNRKFMYSSIYGFSNHDMIDFLESIGLHTKTERGARVFPESDKSSDVISALQREMKRLGVQINLNTEVLGIVGDNRVTGVRIRDFGGREHTVQTDNVILATGGLSYPSTGSTGDGYRFAKTFGHNVTKLLPGLVPFNIKEEWVRLLQGLSLKNVKGTFLCGGRIIYEEFGEMLFTHFGISGPIVLSASSFVKDEMFGRGLDFVIDLKPTLSEEQLDARILRETEENINKEWKNVIEHFLPKKMVSVMLDRIGIPPEKKMNSITKEERKRIVRELKNVKMSVAGFRGYSEAIITRGGIDIKEVNPSTMESKLVKGLYFAGEILDVDAVTGGFNLQIAWSTAHAAATSIDN